MPNVALLDTTGKKVGEITLADSVFGVKVSKEILHMAVVNYLANQRQGTQSALTRAEVSGGGIKPWRQKGTGRARQGSTRAPQWTHGGIAFAPKPRDYSYSLNKKTRKLALLGALSDKVATEDIVVLESLSLSEIKTKEMVKILSAVNVGGKILIVTPAGDTIIYKSARNIPGVKVTHAGSLNVYDLLNCDKLVITKETAEKLEEVYSK